MAEPYREDDPERCPWCGTDAPVGIGTGDRVNIMAYERWLEDHVIDCEPFRAESARDDDEVANSGN